MTRLSAVFIALFFSGAVFLGPAAAQSTSPEALAAAKELVIAARSGDQLKTLLPMIMQQLKPVIVQGRAEVERDYNKIMPVILEVFLQQSGRMIDEIAVIYARNFTADEMRQVTAFYRTPVGQKFLEKLPLVMQESMAVGQKFGQQLVQDMRTRMMEELRKRGHNI